MKVTLLFVIFFLGFLTGRYTTPDTAPQSLINISQPSPAAMATTPVMTPQTSDNNRSKVSGLSNAEEESSLALMPNVLPAIIQAAPQQAVKDVMSYFLDEGELAEISDINMFARRYAEEITLMATESDPSSTTTIKVSLSSAHVEHSSLLNLDKNNSVYAHVNFGGGIAAGSAKIMSRWVNLDTNEVLFFERSSIIPTADNNWVSFKPAEGWKDGNYEVSFYEFSDTMKKLAAQNFYLTTDH